MQISETFIASAGRLSANESGRLWDLIMKLQANPAHPSLSFERVVKARDPNLWSARVSQDLRAILHKSGDSVTALYAGHHEDAYEWARRRTVERHVRTGALQVVVAPETVGSLAPVVERPSAEPCLFQGCTDDYLLSLAVPASWLPTLRRLRTDDELMTACANLPEEVGLRLLSVAAGEVVTPPAPIAPSQAVTDAPDTRQRFFVLRSEEELLPMLEAPLARWLVFLHPSQRQLVDAKLRGATKVTGSAGTGKTVVCLHRAARLAREGARVLLTTYSRTLASDMQANLKLMGDHGWQQRITVSTLDQQALGLVRELDPRATPIESEEVLALLRTRASSQALFDLPFLSSEWQAIVETQGVTTWAAYRDVSRIGRRRPLTARQRKQIWDLFEPVLSELAATHRFTFPMLCNRATYLLQAGEASTPYEGVIVDELQDLDPARLRLVAALAGATHDRLMLAGDAGQRIYGRAYSLLSCGIDVRGRSHTLRVSYRTTEQIRRSAERVLGTVHDPDEGTSANRATRSVLHGPSPTLRGFAGHREKLAWLVEVLRSRTVRDDEIALITRTTEQAQALQEQLRQHALPTLLLDAKTSQGQGIRITTMHRAKGLEFKVVVVTSCSSNELPDPSALAEDEDDADGRDAMARERSLLYVAMTRARDELYLVWVGERSALLEPGCLPS